jgi:predicted TIM-barrel fold metal-dependent hydrolase
MRQPSTAFASLASARGVAVIESAASKATIDALDAAGSRGVRLNLETAGESDPGAAPSQRNRRAAARPQLACAVQHQPAGRGGVAGRFCGAAVPVVFDHFACAKASLGPTQPGFDALLSLVKSGHAYVKISAAYRTSDKAPNFPDTAPLAQALVAANPNRIVWGSNWPHPGRGATRTDIAPPYPSDDGMLLNQLPKWVPDPAIRRKILVDNPARLYDFGPVAL